jgi:hypothetical protein
MRGSMPDYSFDLARSQGNRARQSCNKIALYLRNVDIAVNFFFASVIMT